MNRQPEEIERAIAIRTLEADIEHEEKILSQHREAMNRYRVLAEATEATLSSKRKRLLDFLR